MVDETILETTWNHPFWVVDKKAWVEARDLKVGNRVLLSDGKEVAISGIRSYNVEPTKVYNFEVADNHTYFVGEDGVLVHNYVETLFDVASLGFSINDLKNAIESGDTTDILISTGAVILDGAAVILPVPGGVGVARKIAKEAAEKVVKESAEKVVKESAEKNVKKVHANKVDDRPATLYKKYDKDGNFEKHGITKYENPNQRYTKKQIDGGRVDAVERGPRNEIIKKERNLVETNPGPKNKEPWAGKRKE